MSTFSERIKELRSEKGLSLRDTEKELKAKGINIDFTSISKYERGEREPSVSDAGKLADYYNVSVDYLVGTTDDRMPARLLAYYKALSEYNMNQGENDEKT